MRFWNDLNLANLFVFDIRATSGGLIQPNFEVDLVIQVTFDGLGIRGTSSVAISDQNLVTSPLSVTSVLVTATYSLVTYLLVTLTSTLTSLLAAHEVSFLVTLRYDRGRIVFQVERAMATEETVWLKVVDDLGA